METELFSYNYNKVMSLLLFLNLCFPTNILLVFHTALITTCRQNDGMSACKKFPGSKGQIKELPFFQIKGLVTQSLMSGRMSLEEDLRDQTSQAHRSMSRPLFPVPLAPVFLQMPFSFLTSYFSFWDLKCHFLKYHVNAGFAAQLP